MAKWERGFTLWFELLQFRVAWASWAVFLHLQKPEETCATVIGLPSSLSFTPVSQTYLKHFCLASSLGRPWLPGRLSLRGLDSLPGSPRPSQAVTWVSESSIKVISLGLATLNFHGVVEIPSCSGHYKLLQTSSWDMRAGPTCVADLDLLMNRCTGYGRFVNQILTGSNWTWFDCSKQQHQSGHLVWILAHYLTYRWNWIFFSRHISSASICESVMYDSR